MNALPKRKCKNCEHYPDSCGYWGKTLRSKEKLLGEADIHNCQDYKQK